MRSKKISQISVGKANLPSAGRLAIGLSAGAFTTRLNVIFSHFSILTILCFLLATHCIAQLPPSTIFPSNLEKIQGSMEQIPEPFEGLLVIPEQTLNVADGKYNQIYHAVCFVYVAQRSDGEIVSYKRKFAVYVPERDTLPTAKRVAKLLNILQQLTKQRFKTDHARNLPVVEVWLTAKSGAGLSSDVGGEQFKNQIYIFDIFAERSSSEWFREVCHEYGHYALPGISGFAVPEDWGNGVLGERIFALWIAQELKNERLNAENLPFITAENLSEIVNRQVFPLIQRILSESFDPKTLNLKTLTAIENFCGL